MEVEVEVEVEVEAIGWREPRERETHTQRKKVLGERRRQEMRGCFETNAFLVWRRDDAFLV